MEYFSVKLSSALSFVLIGACLACFFVLFGNLFMNGLTTSREDRFCRFDEQTRAISFRKEIHSINVDQPDPGAITFEFTDQSQYSRALGFFRPYLDSLFVGDTMVKPLDSLYVEVFKEGERVKIDLAYGCKRISSQ